LMAIVRCVVKSSSEGKIGKAERMEGTRIASPPMVPWMQREQTIRTILGSQYFEQFAGDCNEEPHCQKVQG